MQIENKIEMTLDGIRQMYHDNNWDISVLEAFEQVVELIREVSDECSGRCDETDSD